MYYFLIFFSSVLFLQQSLGEQAASRNSTRTKRSPSSFRLAYLQREFEDDEDFHNSVGRGTISDLDGNVRRDEVMSDARCLERCNNQLNFGMDMVNAHMAFGSIDVPSVIGDQDLDLFCHLDHQHSECIDECGYSVQFNLREYVCRQRIAEMKTYLSCYAAAAPLLTRHCRPRCGGYTALKHTLDGYANRCRQLLCDHVCTEFLLRKVCGSTRGKKASRFLLDFTKLQVDYWIRDYAIQNNQLLSKTYPSSCARLQCNEEQIGKCLPKSRRKRRPEYRKRKRIRRFRFRQRRAF
ncbi:unnamed protein product, partial [Mesorhabditis belari]|uniref:Uncharacterized protein n=1 Tax=Mesorhabditis belari TaxID=2138241 RepID=A0AAF3EYB6_9BILA